MGKAFCAYADRRNEEKTELAHISLSNSELHVASTRFPALGVREWMLGIRTSGEGGALPTGQTEGNAPRSRQAAACHLFPSRVIASFPCALI